MADDSENFFLRPETFLFLAMSALTLWLAYRFLGGFFQYVLVPTYAYSHEYFRLYGRITVELFCGVFIIGMGAVLHDKQITRMYEEVRSLAEKYEADRKHLEAELTRKLELIATLTEAKQNLTLQNEEYAALLREAQDETEAIQNEIERLKQPDLAAERARLQEQESGKQELLKAADEALVRYSR